MTLIGPFALALFAGFISVLSPCCLPLMPGYLSYVSTVAGGDEGEVARARVTGASVLFVLGFASVFTIIGASVTLLGGVILSNRDVLIRVAGAFVVLTGLITMGVLRIPALYRERRVRLDTMRRGPLGAFPLGVAFAIGWAPCIGPVLAGILAAAATASTAWRGASMLLVYSLGLGIPFVLLATGYVRSRRMFDWFRRHARGVELTGGGVLVVMGVLMFTGQWLTLFTPIIRELARLGWPPI